MDIVELTQHYNRYRYGEDNFHELMQHRIRRILLVSTFYDAFILEQDGHLAEQIRGYFHRLHLTDAPRIITVPTGEMAMERIEESHFDLVVTMMRIGAMSPFELARRIKENQPELPVIFVPNVASDLARIDKTAENMRYVDDVFLWRGDAEIFLAMVKSIEDRLNVHHDTQAGMVRVILLVEDAISDYSRFLPLLYTEIMKQTQRIIAEERHVASRTLRMRARPKIMLTHTYEDAWQIFEAFKDYLLCVISDVTYRHNGEIDEHAGLKLIENVRKVRGTLPCCLQSTELKHRNAAIRLKASWLHKNSPTALAELRRFIENNLGFGDFIFRSRDGREIARASSMRDFEAKLRIIPPDSLVYHSRKNHYSTWLIARGELTAARRLRPVKCVDFPSREEYREFLIDFFRDIRIQKDKGRIVDFDKAEFAVETGVVRLGPGSLGGKGRGLAFLNAFLAVLELEDRYEGVKIKIPKTAIIGTDEFDYFIEHNRLNLPENFDPDRPDDDEKKRFLQGSLSPSLVERLRGYIEVVHSPLAIRSSSLLEDSQSQPFAGIYQTYMIPNNHPDPDVRLQQLVQAVKLVFASGFLVHAQEYFRIVEYQQEEEKMAVVIQEVVGSVRGGSYFYPHFSGVACSWDYYPMPFMKSEDGIARLAVGLGKYIVDGHDGYRYCPAYPGRSTTGSDEIPPANQWEFSAIDLSRVDFDLTRGEDSTLVSLPISKAEEHGVLWHLASVYDHDSRRIVDGLSCPGPRVIDFSGVLKYDSFPLSAILRELMVLGEQVMGVPVEIEFAVTLDRDRRRDIVPTFYLLQIRPLITHVHMEEVLTGEIAGHEIFVRAEQAVGNGKIRGISDIVYVKPETFNNTRTEEIRQEVSAFNESLKKLDRPYILIGPGRWGTRDRFLGIPVRWEEISRARIIIETGLEGFRVEASQGTHFFHNLLALNVGYLTVPFGSEDSFIDYEWLEEQQLVKDMSLVRHVRTESPVLGLVDGRKGEAIIKKAE